MNDIPKHHGPDLFDRNFYFDGFSFRMIGSLRTEFLGRLAQLEQKKIDENFTRRAEAMFLRQALIDDSLLSVSTAMACLRFFERQVIKGIADISSWFHAEYLRWYEYQKGASFRCDPDLDSLRKLSQNQVLGSTSSGLNSRASVSPVLRVAPIGIFFGVKDALAVGKLNAELTHRQGLWAAGFMAALISGLLRGSDFAQAYEAVMGQIQSESGARELVKTLQSAEKLWGSSANLSDALKSLGEERIADTALAMGLIGFQRKVDPGQKVLEGTSTTFSESLAAIATTLQGAAGLGLASVQSSLPTLPNREKFSALAMECSKIRCILNTDRRPF